MDVNKFFDQTVTREDLEALHEEGSKYKMRYAIDFFKSMMAVVVIFEGKSTDLLSAYLSVYDNAADELISAVRDEKYNSAKTSVEVRA